MSVQQWYVTEVRHLVWALFWVQWSSVKFKSAFSVLISVYEFTGSLWICCKSHFKFMDLLESKIRFLCVLSFCKQILKVQSLSSLLRQLARYSEPPEIYVCCYAGYMSHFVCNSQDNCSMLALPLSESIAMLSDTWIWGVHTVVFLVTPIALEGNIDQITNSSLFPCTLAAGWSQHRCSWCPSMAPQGAYKVTSYLLCINKY